MKQKYHKMYMKMAVCVSEASESSRLKVGTLIVKDDDILTCGLNGTPKGWISNVCEDADTGLTLPEVHHSEQNAILKAAREGRSLKGATAFVTHSPCKACSLLLIGCGIVKVIYKHKYRCTEGLDMLRSAGIIVEEYRE